MRFLLLLSAILSALTGVAGARGAVAQPMAASAPAAGQVARAHVGVAAVAERLLPAAWGRPVYEPIRVARSTDPLRAYPLYADRLRE